MGTFLLAVTRFFFPLLREMNHLCRFCSFPVVAWHWPKVGQHKIKVDSDTLNASWAGPLLCLMSHESQQVCLGTFWQTDARTVTAGLLGCQSESFSSADVSCSMRSSSLRYCAAGLWDYSGGQKDMVHPCFFISFMSFFLQFPWQRSLFISCHLLMVLVNGRNALSVCLRSSYLILQRET